MSQPFLWPTLAGVHHEGTAKQTRSADVPEWRFTPEAVQEFQKAFIIVVLRDVNGNQVRAAKQLGVHRNTLRRNLLELDVDIKAVRLSRRRPPISSRLSPLRDKKTAT